MCFFFFKQKTAYEMRISDWSSDVCSSDLGGRPGRAPVVRAGPAVPRRARRGEPGRRRGGRRGAARRRRAGPAAGATMKRAVAFLTPFGGAAVPDRRTLGWFPVVGALIGATRGGLWWGAQELWSRAVAAGDRKRTRLNSSH